jgi:hypothetical protein
MVERFLSGWPILGRCVLRATFKMPIPFPFVVVVFFLVPIVWRSSSVFNLLGRRRHLPLVLATPMPSPQFLKARSPNVMEYARKLKRSWRVYAPMDEIRASSEAVSADELGLCTPLRSESLPAERARWMLRVEEVWIHSHGATEESEIAFL